MTYLEDVVVDVGRLESVQGLGSYEMESTFSSKLSFEVTNLSLERIVVM